LYRVSRGDPTQTTMTETTTAELDAGTELELTYDGNHGSRTVTVYVVAHDTSENYLNDDATDHELVVAEPGARRPRHVRVALSNTETEDLLALVNENDGWGVVKSLNSKSDRGRRLGGLEGIEPTGDTDARFRYAAAERAATEGDVLLVDGERGVVTETGNGTTVEFDDGSTERLRHDATLGACRRTDDYDRERVAVEATGETVEAPEDAREAFAAMQDYGHGDAAKVVAVEVAGERHEVVHRHDADERGIRLGDETHARRHEQDTLRLDPLGLTLNGERVDAGDLTLVREDDTESDDEDDEDESAEADGGRVVADGGTEPQFETGEAVADATEAEDDRGTMRVVEPHAGLAGEVMVGTTGTTVADYDGNEGVPESERVVSVVFEAWLDGNVPAWDEGDAATLPERLDDHRDEWGVAPQVYDYPESRLTSVEDAVGDDEGDGPDSEGDRHHEDLRDVDTHEAPDLPARADGGDEAGNEADAGADADDDPEGADAEDGFGTAELREGETRDDMSHAERNAAMLAKAERLLDDEDGESDEDEGNDETRADGGHVERTRAGRIRARRLVSETVPVGPVGGDLPAFDVFGEIYREVAGSVLLAAGTDLSHLGVEADDESGVESDENSAQAVATDGGPHATDADEDEVSDP